MTNVFLKKYLKVQKWFGKRIADCDTATTYYLPDSDVIPRIDVDVLDHLVPADGVIIWAKDWNVFLIGENGQWFHMDEENEIIKRKRVAFERPLFVMINQRDRTETSRVYLPELNLKESD